MSLLTIHINKKLLLKIDQVGKEKGISQNRFIIQACERALNDHTSKWPDNFFKTELNKNDLKLLRKTVLEMEQSIIGLRRNRANVDL